MDALIFLLLLATLVAMWRGRKRLAAVLFVVSAVSILFLFLHHATDRLPISL
jgi:fatty acid desaturase